MEITPEVANKLGCYVYKLIDPRNGEIFYVGKGQGDRVIQHVREEARLKDDPKSQYLLSMKMDRIRAIRESGQITQHIIVRHGMSVSQALLVEAVLIEETPGLTNLVAGEGTKDFGSATLPELVGRYSAKKLVIQEQHKILIIKIRESKTRSKSIYDTVRAAWRLNVKRAERANLVFAVTDDLVRGVFTVNQWLPATKANFPDLLCDDIPKRWGFIGSCASDNIKKRYLYKRLPEEFQGKRGMASPIIYTFK